MYFNFKNPLFVRNKSHRQKKVKTNRPTICYSNFSVSQK